MIWSAYGPVTNVAVVRPTSSNYVLTDEGDYTPSNNHIYISDDYVGDYLAATYFGGA